MQHVMLRDLLVSRLVCHYWYERLVYHWHERLVLAACNRACAWRLRCRESGEADPIQCTQAQVRVQVLFNGGVVRRVSVLCIVACSDKPCQGLVFQVSTSVQEGYSHPKPKTLSQGADYRLRSLLRGATDCARREQRVTSNSRRSPSISRRRCAFVLASSAQ